MELLLNLVFYIILCAGVIGMSYRIITFYIEKRKLGPQKYIIGFSFNGNLLAGMILIINSILLFKIIIMQDFFLRGLLWINLLDGLGFIYMGFHRRKIHENGISSGNGSWTWGKIDSYLWYERDENALILKVNKKLFIKTKKMCEVWKIPPQYKENFCKLLKDNSIVEITNISEIIKD